MTLLFSMMSMLFSDRSASGAQRRQVVHVVPLNPRLRHELPSDHLGCRMLGVHPLNVCSSCRTVADVSANAVLGRPAPRLAALVTIPEQPQEGGDAVLRCAGLTPASHLTPHTLTHEQLVAASTCVGGCDRVTLFLCRAR